MSMCLHLKELLATLPLLGILPGSANHLGVLVAPVTKSGGLSLPYNKRRGSYLYPEIRKDMDIWGFSEGVWGSLAVTGEKIESFQMSEEHFPCFHSETHGAAAGNVLILHG